MMVTKKKKVVAFNDGMINLLIYIFIWLVGWLVGYGMWMVLVTGVARRTDLICIQSFIFMHSNRRRHNARECGSFERRVVLKRCAYRSGRRVPGERNAWGL